MKYEDDKFIELARLRGYLDEQKMDSARRSRADMAEMGVKDEFLIGDLLVQSGAISQTQHDEIVRELAATRISGYLLEKVLGRGMSGTSYLARKSMNNHLVCIKIMETGGDETLEKRFSREAAVAKQLQHPNIVGALGVGKEGDIFYFVTEYFPGKTARQVIKESGPVDEKTGLKVLESIGRALEAVWRLKIVHRDIKPDNILFADDGQIRLMELGTVKSAGSNAQNLTMPGMVLGSVDYMSPEQAIGGQSLDVRSDIYSLGATAYQLVTGKTPWEGQPPAARMKGRPPAPRDRNAALTDGFNRVIVRCLQQAADLRYQTPAELIADVQRVAQGRALGPAAAESTGRALPVARARESEDKDRTVLWAVLIGAGLGIAGLILTLLLLR